MVIYAEETNTSSRNPRTRTVYSYLHSDISLTYLCTIPFTRTVVCLQDLKMCDQAVSRCSNMDDLNKWRRRRDT